jgi:hypothetical protein
MAEQEKQIPNFRKYLVGGKPVEEAGIGLGGEVLTSERLNSMTDDERVTLLYIINVTHSPVTIVEIDPQEHS